MPVNHQIVYYLQDALNLLPDLSEPETTKSFASSANDELLVVYMSSLLRAVIALHALVDNKATIGKEDTEEKLEVKENAKKETEKSKAEKKTDGKDSEKEKGS